MAYGWGDNAWSDFGWGGVTAYDESITESLNTQTAWGADTWGSSGWGGVVAIAETQEAQVTYGVAVNESGVIADNQSATTAFGASVTETAVIKDSFFLAISCII